MGVFGTDFRLSLGTQWYVKRSDAWMHTYINILLLWEQQKTPRREYVWQTHNRSQLLHMEDWGIDKVFNYCWLKLLGRARHLIPEFSPHDFTKSVKSASQEDTFHLCVFVCYFRYLALRECKWPANPERDSTKLSTRNSRLCHLYWLKLLKLKFSNIMSPQCIISWGSTIVPIISLVIPGFNFAFASSHS